MEKYFSREFDVVSTGVSLEFLQHTIGDVGCVVWDAALVLAGYLDRLHSSANRSMKDLRILELGSGTGCVGLVAGALGGNVVLTDLPEMVPLMKKNVMKNKSSLSGKVEARAFEWGSDCSSLGTGQFDLVLAADCIYYKKSLDAFIKTLEDLVHYRNLSDESDIRSKTSSTEIYVSYEDRGSDEKKLLIQDFKNRIQSSCNVSHIPFQEYREDFMCEDIHILKITPKQNSS